VVAFVFMALALANGHGRYSPAAISLLVVSAIALAAAAWRNRTTPSVPDEITLDRLLAVALIFLLIAGLFNSPGYHLRNELYRQAFRSGQVALALAVALVFLVSSSRSVLRTRIVLLGVALGLGLRIGMVMASPAPRIDVFTQFQESAVHLLHGLNPFATAVSDPYLGEKSFGYSVNGYSYPPASLYPQTLAYFLFGDIRYAYVAFETIAIAALYALAAPARRSAAGLLVLLFLFHPRGLFEIEQAWNEPLLVGAAAFFIWVVTTRPASRWVPVAFGLFLSLKQYLVFFALLFLAPRARWRLVPVVTGVIVLTWLPFLLWDARSAVDNGLLFQFRTPFRDDGLTLSTLLYRWCGWMPTKWIAIGVGCAVAAVAAARFRDGTTASWLYASVLTTLAVFLAGSQAFCNYYYFLGSLILFLLALRLRETSAA
jgi:hypothetical protein